MDRFAIGPIADPMEATKAAAINFKARLNAVRGARLPQNGLPWYPYDILGNVWHLSEMLSKPNRSVFQNVKGRRIADIGTADGDLGLFLASLGASVDLIDYEPTNMNHFSGARTLVSELNIPANIISMNVDDQFSLDGHYDLTLFLGILYHVKNPFYILETLARHSRHLFVSTRIAEYTAPVGFPHRGKLPGTSVYLLDSKESNSDDTNYWTFNEASLRLLFHRTGWNMLDYLVVGGPLETSDPTSEHGDRRAFGYLESRHFNR